MQRKFYCKRITRLHLKVIWEQAVLPMVVGDPLIAAMYNCLIVFVRWANVHCARPSILIHDSIGPTHSPYQMTGWLAQPLLHSQCHILPIICYTVRWHNPPKFAYYCGGSAPHMTCGTSMDLPTTLNGILIKSAIFPEFMVANNRQTNRITDRMNMELYHKPTANSN